LPLETADKTSMDALSEALRAVHVTGALFIDAELSAPWGVAVPEAQSIAPILAPATEQIVNYHLVLDGETTVETEGAEPLALSGGDIVIMTSGSPHRLSGGAPNVFHDSRRALPRILHGRLVKLRFGGGGPVTRLVCGFFGCDRHAAQTILSGAPSVLKISVREDAGGVWLERSILHLVSDVETQRAGRSLLLSRMAEVLFIESLRRYAETLPADQVGWLAGARDPVVGRALAALHREPARRWSAEEIAEAAGASRTILAERFTRVLGATPLTYLTHWRMQTAARLLRTTKASVLQTALEVGYESEAAFNRAFNREFGVPPARYRKMFRD
jgi:AraC-like DNA-binding protein